tara:strand:- start:273 stop:518 length:246 start_codon:yes stop_codon:yes gene_type:complete
MTMPHGFTAAKDPAIKEYPKSKKSRKFDRTFEELLDRFKICSKYDAFEVSITTLIKDIARAIAKKIIVCLFIILFIIQILS